MKIFWLIAAGVCIIVAAVLMLRQDFNTAFVVAALGLVSWFLNYRVQMKEITNAADPEQSNESESEKGVNDSDGN